MSIEKRITQEAKQRLSGGNWSKAVCGGIIYCCIPLIIFIIYSIIAEVFEKNILDLNNYTGKIDMTGMLMVVFSVGLILICLMFTPIFLGYKRLLYQTAKDDEPEFNDLFYFFRTSDRYFTAIKYYLLKTAFIVFYAFLYFAIPVLLTVYADDIKIFMQLPDDRMFIIWAVLALVYLLAAVLFIGTALRRYLMGYLVCENYKNPLADTVSLSSRLMRGNKVKIIKLALKMLPWILLCVTVVPIIYVLPYVKESFAVCSKWIVQLNTEYNEEKITEQQVIS